MPADRNFALRSAIERWALDDWLHWGASEAKVKKMRYVDVFLGYWKRFHIQLAITGMPAKRTAQLIPYGQKYMIETVKGLYEKFGVELEPEEFKVSKPEKFEDREEKSAEQTLIEVNQAWEGLGLKLPVAELAERN